MLGVQYPGRQDRRHEPLIEDIGQLADEICEALIPWETQPLAFFGHSMGAVVAFEVARRFQRDDRRAPLALFASGRRAPSRHRDEDSHAADDDSIIANLRSLGGTDPALLEDDEMRRVILPVIRGDYRAVETYRAPTTETTLNVPIMAITGDRDPSVSLEEASAWREHAAGSFEIKVLTGGHFFIHEHIAEIADCVRRVLFGFRSERGITAERQGLFSDEPEEGAAMDAGLEVSCPMCGGLIEATDKDELIRLSQLHTLDAHCYNVPAEHVLAAMTPGDIDPGQGEDVR